MLIRKAYMHVAEIEVYTSSLNTRLCISGFVLNCLCPKRQLSNIFGGKIFCESPLFYKAFYKNYSLFLYRK